ncbi:MAG: hypothetical protein AB1523_10250 [Bacillota bacterium]
MKKLLIILVILAILALVATAAGCTVTSALEGYKAAAKKTAQVDRAQTMATFNYHMDFTGPGLTPEGRKNLEIFREVKGTFVTKFDRKKKIIFVDGHLDLAGMGLDIKAWSDGDRVILLLPMFTRYLVLDWYTLAEQARSGESQPEPGVGEKLKELWKGLLNPNNISRTGERLIATAEGDIRATGYRVTLSEAEIKNLSREFLRIIFSDRELRGWIVKNWLKYSEEKDKTGETIERELDQMAETVQNNIDRAHIKKFEYTGAVDRDSYLVEENVAYKADVDTGKGVAVDIDYTLQIKRWAFGREVQVDFPRLDAANSFTLEAIDENTPKMFEGLLKKK